MNSVDLQYKKMMPKFNKKIFLPLLLFFVLSIAIFTSFRFGWKANTISKKVVEKAPVATFVPVVENKLRTDIVTYAYSFLGAPYVPSGCSADGFDCSGFVYFVFQHFNIKTPRSSIDFENFGKTVAMGDIQNGDVVVFLSPTRPVIGHVGIVTKANGDSSEFIHSSSGKEMRVIISHLYQPGYKSRYFKAVDVLGEAGKSK